VSRDSSVGIALGYGLDDRGSRVRFPEGAGNFSLHHCVQTGSGAHPASYPMRTRTLSLRVKRPGREADLSPPSSAELKECVELYLHSPNTPSWRGSKLKKHRDNFTFTFFSWLVSLILVLGTCGAFSPWQQYYDMSLGTQIKVTLFYGVQNVAISFININDSHMHQQPCTWWLKYNDWSNRVEISYYPRVALSAQCCGNCVSLRYKKMQCNRTKRKPGLFGKRLWARELIDSME
jgi:hypothetical protein